MTRKHPHLPDLTFKNNIIFTTDLQEVLQAGEIIFLATPSHSIKGLARSIGKSIRDHCIIVNLAKGIELDTLMTMSQVIRLETDIDSSQIVSLYGPSHAEEVVRNLPTTLVAASTSDTTSAIIQELMSSEVLRVYRNEDIIGVEIGGSLTVSYTHLTLPRKA